IVVQGERDRVKQALLNLGINALQHTPSGGAVTLGLERQGDYAALTVTDSGNGIGADDLPYIFDRFYRADRSRSRHQGGAGLGLAIVKWVGEAHSGRIEVTSELGAGSEFSWLLPLKTDDAVEVQFTHQFAVAR